MRNAILAVMLGVVANVSLAADWSKNFWAWGQGLSTNQAANVALTRAKPEIDKLRSQCDTTLNAFNYTTSYGYCSTHSDPLFCPSGCYVCPVYGVASCARILKIGDLVETLVDADLYSGNQVVGHVQRGEKFRVAKIQDPWISLETENGTPVTGWIQRTQITIVMR